MLNILKIHLTPLHWAAKNGHLEVAKYLIKSGADVDAKDLVRINKFN